MSKFNKVRKKVAQRIGRGADPNKLMFADREVNDPNALSPEDVRAKSEGAKAGLTGLVVVPQDGTVAAGSPPPAGPVLAAGSHQPPRRPWKPLPPALQGKTLDIAERSDGTFSGFMRELDKEGYVVFDYETTGLKNDGNVPVQIGAVKIKDGEVVERFNVFVNPERPLGEWAKENLKGPDGGPLTDGWLAQQMSLRDAHEQLAGFIGEHVLVAHNFPFDGEVLERTMREQGVDFAPAGSLDTFSLVKQLVPASYGRDPELPENHKLPTLAEFYGVPLGDGAHTADADCEAAAQILRKVLEHGERRGVEPHMLDRVKQQERYEAAVARFEQQKVEYEQYKAEQKRREENAVRVGREEIASSDPF